MVSAVHVMNPVHGTDGMLHGSVSMHVLCSNRVMNRSGGLHEHTKRIFIKQKNNYHIFLYSRIAKHKKYNNTMPPCIKGNKCQCTTAALEKRHFCAICKKELHGPCGVFNRDNSAIT